MNEDKAAPSAGNLPVESPLDVATAEAVTWDAQCDLLVVGLGAAGAAAAISAAESGLEVTAVDRFGRGGASAMSGGVVYAGGGTAQQKRAGFEDTPQAMFDYLRHEVGDAVTADTLRRFCEDSRGLIQWLESLGARFDSDQPPPKTSYPRDGVYLYFSGNETIEPYCNDAPPAPRGHRTVDSGLSGQRLYRFLRARVDALKIPVRDQCAVRRLIRDSSGAIVGAEAWQLEADSPAARRHLRLIRLAEALHNFVPGIADRLRKKAVAIELKQARLVQIRARRGVLLTTGGFVFNSIMLGEHAPEFSHNLRLGSTGCDGSGIRLGLAAGARADRLERASAWRFINPPTAWPGGIIVDGNGQRFCNEAAYGARIGVSMCEKHAGRAWLILDRRIRSAAFREALKGKLWGFQRYPAMILMLLARRARQIEKLAQRLELPPDTLAQTLADHNAAARGECPDEQRKPQSALAELKPPFYALDISAGNPFFPLPTITLGGLCVDQASGAVLNSEGAAIPGLYAAGRAAVGIASNHYVSGLSLADCLWSGRRAGQSVSQVMSRLTWHRLRVSRVIEETADARSLEFEIPPPLRSLFAYRPGQHLTLRVPCQNGVLPRCYSASSSPLIDEPLRVTVKRVADGRASNWICDEVCAGMELEVAAPAGVFIAKSFDGDNLLLAGGSGITPVLSIIRSVLTGGCGQLRLIYANRDEKSVIFATELARLARQHPMRLQVIHWLDSLQGHPSQAQIEALSSGWQHAECFICGPTAFMEAAQGALRDLGVPHARTHIERFVSLPVEKEAIEAVAVPPTADPAASVALTVLIDGEEKTLSARADQLLIEAMEEAGLEAPYSCRAGACGACMCKLESGEVKLDENHVLDQHDLDAGWILTCQARPRSSALTLSYPE